MNTPPQSGSKLRVLFIARRYPPTRGGAQTHAHKLYTYLSTRMSVRLVALRQGHILHLAWFLPWAWLHGLVALLLRRVDIVYFSDGVAASVAAGLAPFKGPVRFCCSLYGLEMTFPGRAARALMRAGTLRCDGIAVISDNSIDIAARQWGVPRQRMRLIYLGAEPEPLPEARDAELREAFETEHGLRFGRDRIALTLCRHVPRKGIAPFVERGVPLLRDDIQILVVGGGPETPRVQAARDTLGQPERVRLLGVLDDETCSMLRRHADLFLMPNVAIDGDVEGYGIAPLEAMYLGTPVVSFAVDALVEAVREGGWLVPPGDYRAFADAVHAFYDLSPEARAQAERAAQDYCRREYGWDTTAARYAELFTEICHA